MLAAVMTAFEKELTYTRIPDPTLQGPDDVIVQVEASGLCGSDLHIRSGSLEGVLGRPNFPYVLGHETVGTVVEIGAGVTAIRVGDAVALHPLITCGSCPDCRGGRDMYCANPQFPGVDQRTSGGFAEYVRTGARSCVVLPAGVAPMDFVAATDAGLTAYHAVKRAIPFLRPGFTVVVIGVGGVGQFAIQCTQVLSSVNIVAADVSEDRLADARALGVLDTVLIAPDNPLASWTERLGSVDLVFDCVGTSSSLESGLALLRRGGMLSIVGAGGELRLSSVAATGRELTVMGNYVGHYEDLLELVALIQSGAVSSSQVKYALADAEQAMQDLANGKLSGRGVLIP
jgi:2-desacetyl-2-hydroxyethyl bacteriochlorophyllide A dehydrogenase